MLKEFFTVDKRNWGESVTQLHFNLLFILNTILLIAKPYEEKFYSELSGMLAIINFVLIMCNRRHN